MAYALVVDDSRAMRSILRRFLSDLGYEVLEAGDGQEAMSVLDSVSRTVDVVLVDWNMPVMNGFEFVKALRARREHWDTAIIMVSAENDRAKIARALMVGADEYAMKPVNADIIASKISLAKAARGAR